MVFGGRREMGQAVRMDGPPPPPTSGGGRGVLIALPFDLQETPRISFAIFPLFFRAFASSLFQSDCIGMKIANNQRSKGIILWTATYLGRNDFFPG